MEDKAIVDLKVIIISKIKLQIILPNHFGVGSHEHELRYFYVITTNTMVSSIEILLVNMGDFFKSGGIKIVFYSVLDSCEEQEF